MKQPHNNALQLAAKSAAPIVAILLSSEVKKTPSKKDTHPKKPAQETRVLNQS